MTNIGPYQNVYCTSRPLHVLLAQDTRKIGMRTVKTVSEEERVRERERQSPHTANQIKGRNQKG